jgi:hypothetical protein
MTVSEYEERFRSTAPSLHQTFAAMQGPNRGQRRSRYFWVAAALVSVVTMTSGVTSYHALHAKSLSGSKALACEPLTNSERSN